MWLPLAWGSCPEQRVSYSRRATSPHDGLPFVCSLLTAVLIHIKTNPTFFCTEQLTDSGLRNQQQAAQQLWTPGLSCSSTRRVMGSCPVHSEPVPFRPKRYSSWTGCVTTFPPTLTQVSWGLAFTSVSSYSSPSRMSAPVLLQESLHFLGEEDISKTQFSAKCISAKQGTQSFNSWTLPFCKFICDTKERRSLGTIAKMPLFLLKKLTTHSNRNQLSDLDQKTLKSHEIYKNKSSARTQDKSTIWTRLLSLQGPGSSSWNLKSLECIVNSSPTVPTLFRREPFHLFTSSFPKQFPERFSWFRVQKVIVCIPLLIIGWDLQSDNTKFFPSLTRALIFQGSVK